MAELATAFVHLQGVLDNDDLSFLRRACQVQLNTQGMPCFTLLEHHASPTYLRIKEVIERRIGEPLYYLNDFYLYTDSSFKTNWHMDTELFTFASALNAWILLSPDQVENPLGFISGINDAPERYYHSVKMNGDEAVFGDYRTGRTLTRSLKTIEAEHIKTPKINVGDILLLNPRWFHKTNVDSPKHAVAIKFLLKAEHGFLANPQVRPLFWPEVATFNKLVKQGGGSWDNVVAGIREALKTEVGRKNLSSGFYPEKFPLYQKMAAQL